MGRSPWRRLGLFGGLFALALVLALIGIVLRVEDLQTAANVAQLVSVVLAIPALAVPLWLWWRRTAPLAEQDLANAKESLAKDVEKQWKREARARGLDERYTMPVRWRLTTDEAIMHIPARLSDTNFTATSTEIADLVAQFREFGRLVILGGPGAGKTSLAVQILLALLKSRPGTDPVPVLLSLTGWDVKDAEGLPEWVAGRLRAISPLSQAAATALADGEVLLVLDGLDELPKPVRSQVIDVLSEVDIPLVLTCRTQDYRQAVRAGQSALSSAGVIEPEPLTPATAVDYLRKAIIPPPGPEWDPVLTALQSPQPPKALAGVLSTPLGLWLIRTTFRQPGLDPKQLLDPGQTAADLRGRLFALLIPALVKHRGSRNTLDPDKVSLTLSSLAYYLDQTTPDGKPGARDFRWWRLPEVAAPPRRAIRRTMTVAGAAMGALLGGVLVAPAPHGVVMFGSIVFGMFGAMVGLGVGAVAARGYFRVDPVYADPRSGRQLARLAGHIGLGLLGGVAFGLVGGLLLWQSHGAWAGILGTTPPSWMAERYLDNVRGALRIGLPVGITFGVNIWVDSPSPTGEPSNPYQSWRAARDGGLVRLAGFALAGAVFGAYNMFADGKPGQAVSTALICAVTALAVGVFTERRAWLIYAITAGFLARQRVLPRRLMTFLDQTHRLGLLRAVGPTYQFRHAEFQDYLTSLPRDTPVGAEPERPPLGFWRSTLKGAGAGAAIVGLVQVIFGTQDHLAYGVVAVLGIVAIRVAGRGSRVSAGRAPGS